MLQRSSTRSTSGSPRRHGHHARDRRAPPGRVGAREHPGARRGIPDAARAGRLGPVRRGAGRDVRGGHARRRGAHDGLPDRDRVDPRELRRGRLAHAERARPGRRPHADHPRGHRPRALGGVPRGTLRDASVRVYWWDEEHGRYADAAGEPIEEGPTDRHARHGLLPVSSPTGMPIALIRHDKVLTDNMRLLDGVSSALRLSVDNGRLRSEIERTLEQVRQSRQHTWKRVSRPGGASSATCTTARSSTSCPSGCDCASPPTPRGTPTRCSSRPSSRAPSPC